MDTVKIKVGNQDCKWGLSINESELKIIFL